MQRVRQLAFLFAQGTHYAHAADRKADYGAESCDQHDISAEMKEIGDYRARGEDQTQHVQPQWRVDALVRIFSETEL